MLNEFINESNDAFDSFDTFAFFQDIQGTICVDLLYFTLWVLPYYYRKVIELIICYEIPRFTLTFF